MRRALVAPLPPSRLLPGDHACWFFHSPQEHREGVTTFVRTALDRGGKVLYLADTIPPATVAAYLRRAGLDPDALMASGQLVLRPHRDAGSNRAFDPARHVQLFGELVEQARAERYRGLWATGEATWQLHDGIAAAGPSMELEQLLERLFAGTGDGLLLCQYDAGAIQPRPLERLRSTHNLELAAAGPRPLGRTIFELTMVPADCGMAVSGEVDMRSWAALANALRRAADMAADGRRVVLDLTRLSFIDGHGVGLIGTVARALGPSRPLLLRGAPPILLRIAEIIGLDREPGLIIEGRDADGHR